MPFNISLNTFKNNIYNRNCHCYSSHDLPFKPILLSFDYLHIQKVRNKTHTHVHTPSNIHIKVCTGILKKYELSKYYVRLSLATCHQHKVDANYIWHFN